MASARGRAKDTVLVLGIGPGIQWLVLGEGPGIQC